jgi:acetyltransferase-like isoleucine patch superfamily enzyme
LTIFLQKLRGVRIGENSVIGRFVYIDDYKPELVKIGKNVVVSTGSIILTHKRNITDYKVTKAYYEYPYIFGQVIISDNVQIGVGAILMPGITIGEGSIVGAGAVVTKDIPSGCLAIGSPAKVVKNYLDV